MNSFVDLEEQKREIHIGMVITNRLFEVFKNYQPLLYFSLPVNTLVANSCAFCWIVVYKEGFTKSQTLMNTLITYKKKTNKWTHLISTLLKLCTTINYWMIQFRSIVTFNCERKLTQDKKHLYSCTLKLSKIAHDHYDKCCMYII